MLKKEGSSIPIFTLACLLKIPLSAELDSPSLGSHCSPHTGGCVMCSSPPAAS